MPKASEKANSMGVGQRYHADTKHLRTIVGFLYSRSPRPDSKASTAADLEACSLHRVPSFAMTMNNVSTGPGMYL